MSTYLSEIASIDPAVHDLDEQLQTPLTTRTEELAGLRLSIMLTAKWEASDTLTAERRSELRDELADLRFLYLDKIDKIAMAFGVQRAIETKEEVERAVAVPKDMSPSVMPIELEQLNF